MATTAFTPVFVGLRTGLHVLFLALALLVAVRTLLAPTATTPWVLALSTVILATYCAGALLPRRGRPRSSTLTVWWLVALTVEWFVLLQLSSDAAYLVFPLFFLFLHLLARPWGAVAIVAATLLAIVTLGLRGGWTVGGVVGPMVGAGVALLIGLGYQALAREAEIREELLRELIETRDQLASTEREAGILSERSRLAREIHDTVAQGLSSIQMLLHAAEGADADRPGIEHIRLARETAADNLADTRRFISELSPRGLDDHGLAGVLRRLAEGQWAAEGLAVAVRASDSLTLPMPVQVALLRIAQGAVANVIQHARATRATIDVDLAGDLLCLTISDDGIGFDPVAVAAAGGARSDSFGLRATAERVEQLGGSLTIDAAPGRGTTIVVALTVTSAIEAPA